VDVERLRALVVRFAQEPSDAVKAAVFSELATELPAQIHQRPQLELLLADARDLLQRDLSDYARYWMARYSERLEAEVARLKQ
jgi:hypothetical protein